MKGAYPKSFRITMFITQRKIICISLQGYNNSINIKEKKNVGHRGNDLVYGAVPCNRKYTRPEIRETGSSFNTSLTGSTTTDHLRNKTFALGTALICPVQGGFKAHLIFLKQCCAN